MAAERLSMRKIKEILRLKAAGHTKRAIARSLAISHSTVQDYLGRAEAAGVGWPVPPEWTEAELEGRLFPPTQPFYPRMLRPAHRRNCPVPLYPRQGMPSATTSSPPHSGTGPTTAPYPIRSGTQLDRRLPLATA